MIITVGDPGRVEKVSRYFDNVELTASRDANLLLTRGVCGIPVASRVISTGIGTDNVDIVLNELHTCFIRLLRKIHYGASQLSFVRLGTSGAVQPDIEIDSILLSEYALGLDNLLQFYRWEHMACDVAELMRSDDRWRNLPRPYATQADESLFEAFKKLGGISGVTLTAPGFYAPQGRSVNLIPRVADLVELLKESPFHEQKITNIEMETAGIYGMATLLGHRAISISAILANRFTGEFSKHPADTVDQMIQQALKVIPEL